jgi:uncharacterized protein DUF6343/DUF3099 family protein
VNVRSGDEPRHARSPLRLRLVLAGFGLVAALVAAFVVRRVAPGAVVAAFLAVAVLAAVDLVVVVHHLRRGPHYQPGPGVPPYRPVEDRPPPRSAATAAPERIRMRRYLAIMVTCLVLITLAWTWVRLWSTTTAVVMSAVAAVLPPVAVIVANFGVQFPPEPPRDPPNPPGRPPNPPPDDPPTTPTPGDA